MGPFLAYIPNDDPRPFSDIYCVYRLKSSRIPANTQIYISTIQRMYSIRIRRGVGRDYRGNPI